MNLDPAVDWINPRPLTLEALEGISLQAIYLVSHAPGKCTTSPLWLIIEGGLHFHRSGHEFAEQNSSTKHAMSRIVMIATTSLATMEYVAPPYNLCDSDPQGNLTCGLVDYPTYLARCSAAPLCSRAPLPVG